MVEKKVCIQCAKNKGLQSKIKQLQRKGVCSYCGSADWVELLPNVVKYIEKCILRDYDQGSAGAYTYNIKDIFDDKKFQAEPRVKTDIAKALIKNTYSLKSEVNIHESPEQTQPLLQRWALFEQLIKTKNRFFCKTTSYLCNLVI